MAKKHLIPVEFESIIARALKAADEPIAELEIEIDDIDWDAPAPASEPRSATVPSGPGTIKVTIRIPTWVIAHYKAKAESTGVPYQRLINRLLMADARTPAT